jgi:4-carboxymuconolactone decarboxylase
MAGLSQEERNAAAQRLVRQLGVDRIGTAAGAKPLPPLGGRSDIRGSALAIEAEVLGVQLYEYEVWARPDLDLKTRSFITVATLVAMRETDLLYRHLNVALNLGITPEELHEVFLHGAVYAGFAAWNSAYQIANELFVARGILEPGSGVAISPRPPMTREERVAARDRIIAALGVGRIGATPDAPMLERMPGGPSFAGRVDPDEQEMILITADYGYGEVWGRPGLPLRIRSFVTMSILQAMVENHQLHIHICNALNIGITRREIGEMTVQVGLYHGNSGQHNAITVAQHVFAQHPAGG